MKKLLTSKWVIMLAVAIGLVVFNALVFNVSIVKRNIVVGIGLDYDGKEYTLYTQVVLPKNGGVTSGGNNYVTLKGTASNIDSAVDKIEKEQGAILSFAQAAILILGKNMLDSGNLDMVDAFFMDNRVHDNLFIVMAEDKADEVLKANVAAGEVASLQLITQLRPTKAPLGVSTITLQEYVRNSKNNNRINYMPIISVQKTPPSTDQSTEDKKEADKFLISNTALIDEKGLQCELDEKMTKSFTLAKLPMQDGVIEVEGENNFSVHLVSSKPKFEFDLDKMECKLKLSIKTIRAESRFENGKVTFKMSDEEQKRLIESINKDIQELFDFGKQNNVDMFNIFDGFLKKYPKKSSQIMAEDFLDKVKFVIDVKISQVN